MANRYEDKNGKNGTNTQGNTGTKKPRIGATLAVNISWGLADPAMLAWCVTRLTTNGGGVILGSTRDGGALSLTVLYGDDKEKYYITPADDLNRVLKEVGEYYGE